MSNLKICYICGGAPKQRTTEDRNYIGVMMFKSVMTCKECGRKIEEFARSKTIAELKAQARWNGVKDADTISEGIKNE